MKRPGIMARLLVTMGLLSLASTVHAYPNGPLWYATDVAPYCAGCHASTSPGQFPEHPKEFAEQWTVEGKHLGDLTNGQRTPLSNSEKHRKHPPKPKNTLYYKYLSL